MIISTYESFLSLKLTIITNKYDRKRKRMLFFLDAKKKNNEKKLKEIFDGIGQFKKKEREID